MHTRGCSYTLCDAPLFCQGTWIEMHDLPWYPHASFQGVSLKHVVIARDTNGSLSCHLVRVEPNCELGRHTHEKECELHEVLEGGGRLVLNGVEAQYAPGVKAVIPRGLVHQVKAGDHGLVLMAKFSPAFL